MRRRHSPARYAYGYVAGLALAGATQIGLLQGLAGTDGRRGVWDAAAWLDAELGRGGASLAILAAVWVPLTLIWMATRRT